MHSPFNDRILGQLTYDAAQGDWNFAISLPSGQSVTGSIFPEDNRLPLQQNGLTEIARRVEWVVAHELQVRRTVHCMMVRANAASGLITAADPLRR